MPTSCAFPARGRPGAWLWITAVQTVVMLWVLAPPPPRAPEPALPRGDSKLTKPRKAVERRPGLRAVPTAPARPNVWPLPRLSSSGDLAVLVDVRDFRFHFDGASAALQTAFVRFQTRYFPHRVRRWTAKEAGYAGTVRAVRVEVTDGEAELQLGVDESYILEVDSTGGVRIAAATQFGAYHAMETLAQLIAYDATAKTPHYVIRGAPWRVDDAPRFAHRELLLDTSRHFQPLASLHRLIDSLPLAKINTLHWHLVDRQAFPWAPASAPEMAQGAYSADEVYTHEDVEDVVAYALARGVRVVLEIDTPGHAESWCVSHPEVCPSRDCPMPLRPDKAATFDLIETLFRDAAAVAPDAYMHIGGDEVDTSCWEQNAEIAAWMRERGYSPHQAYLYFVERVTAVVHGLGRHVVGWDELWANFGSALDKKTIIHQWRHWEPAVQAATAAGYRVLWSNASPWYLNGRQRTWEMMYSEEPCKGLADEECALVLGGGGSMWGEFVDPSDIQMVVWPRLGAVAERLWSPPARTATPEEAAPRYAAFRCYLTRQGVGAGPHGNPIAGNGPEGPGGCYEQ